MAARVPRVPRERGLLHALPRRLWRGGPRVFAGDSWDAGQSPRRGLSSLHRARSGSRQDPGPVGVSPMASAETIRVSAILPIHNEAAVLRLVLGAIDAQSHRPDEVILVFDRCSDGSEEIAVGRGYVSLLVDYGNTGASIQARIDRAAHETIVLFDGNTLVPSDYVERLVATWHSTGADLVEWHGGLMLVTKSMLRRYGAFSTMALWTLEYFHRIKKSGGTVVPLKGPFVRLKPSPIRRNVQYGLDYAVLSERYGLAAFFRIGAKMGC